MNEDFLINSTSSLFLSEKDQFWQEHCSVIPPEQHRMILVAIIGSLIASISFIFNGFLFLILISKRQNRKKHLLYLMIMAIIDVFLSGTCALRFYKIYFFLKLDFKFKKINFVRFILLAIYLSHLII